MPDLSLFRFSCPVELRYADIDALQHVNNVTYFTYMETARVHYFAQVVGWSGGWHDFGVIVARATCDYLLPLVWGDEVRLYLRTARLGHKSFDFEYVLTRQRRDQPPEIAALGMTVQVAYDYSRNTSIPIPDVWRERITAFEPALSRASGE